MQQANNDVVTSNVSADVSRVTGRVKWFNNKAGYGFITVSSGPFAGDVFVHHSAIEVNEEQYRYLVQGEYIEFECIPVSSGPHQWQASGVRGLNSGPMMCETRRTTSTTRVVQNDDVSAPQHRTHSQHHRQVRQSPTSHNESEEVSQYQSDRPRRSRRPQYLEQSHSSHGGRLPSEGSRLNQQQNDEYEWLLVRRNNQTQGTQPPVRRVRRQVQVVSEQQ
jgi:cold shock CspA family protein